MLFKKTKTKKKKTPFKIKINSKPKNLSKIKMVSKLAIAYTNYHLYLVNILTHSELSVLGYRSIYHNYN